jgi:peptide/nickel transport system permease protein
VRTARAKGVGFGRVIFVHALRNALLPVITLSAMQLPTLLGGAVVIEDVFDIPGLGHATIRAVRSHDYPWLMASILVTAAVATFVMILSDVGYALLDPRLRSALVGDRRSPG